MNKPVNIKMSGTEWAMLLTLSILWGGSFFFVEVAIQSLPVLSVVTLRVALAASALWIYALARGLHFPRGGRVWVLFLGMGMLNNVIPFSLIVWGQTHIASGLASILNATTPLFTVIIAGTLLRDEPITPAKIFGVFIGFTGVVVLISPGSFADSFAEFGKHGLAQAAVLCGAMSFAFAGVFGRQFASLGISPVISATGQVTMSSLILIPLALWTTAPSDFYAVSLEAWASILALALLSTAVAYVLYFRILSSAGATNLLLVTFLIPVTAILLGVLFLGERMQPEEITGMMFIALGLVTMDGRLLAWFRRHKTPVKAGYE